MHQPQQSGSFEHIPLAAIRPSSTNPRKHFDPAALEELTQSVRELGVTVPILVRSIYCEDDFCEPHNFIAADSREGCSKCGGDPNDPVHVDFTRYEIVTGERRWRAAQAAGLEEIPAIVHDGLSDEDAMDLQMVENLQRADLHPVEEAEGYRALLAHGATAEDIAKKAGKTLGYVQQRLKLLALEVDAKKLFADGHLTLGHALLLARLTAADQIRALVFLLGIPQYEITKNDPAEKVIAHRGKTFNPEYRARLVNSNETQLREWIRDNVLLQLKGVAWDLGDAELLPVAGPCTTCPKRTGANAALFADLTTVEDTCVDPACFADKQKAFTLLAQVRAKQQGSPLLKISAKHSTEKLDKPVVEIRASAVKLQQGKPVETQRAVVVANKPVKEGQWVGSKQGACPATVQAIATDGPDTGKLRWVCADQACKVHHHHVQPTRAMTHGVSPASHADPRKLQEENIFQQRVQKAVDEALLVEIQAADAYRAHMMSFFVCWFVESGGWSGDVEKLCEYLSIGVPTAKKSRTEWETQTEQTKLANQAFRAHLESITASELDDIAVALLVSEAADGYSEGLLEKVAKALGIDAEGIAQKVRDKANADRKAAAEAVKAAAKPTAPAKKTAKTKAVAETVGA